MGHSASTEVANWINTTLNSQDLSNNHWAYASETNQSPHAESNYAFFGTLQFTFNNTVYTCNKIMIAMQGSSDNYFLYSNLTSPPANSTFGETYIGCYTTNGMVNFLISPSNGWFSLTK